MKCIQRLILQPSQNSILFCRWFEVEKVAVDEITPIDHACETVAAKNAELRHLAAVAESSGSPSSGYGNKTDSSGSVRKLTQTLQGVIDAAVNGGVSKYSNESNLSRIKF